MKLEKYKSGKNTYLRIVTSYRDPVTKKPVKDVHATLGNILNYDDGMPNLFERLKKDFDQGLVFREFIKQDIEFKINKNDDTEAFLEIKNLGYLFLDKIYDELGITKYLNNIQSLTKIEYEVNNLTKLLTFGRVLSPMSKIKTIKTNDIYHFPVIKKPSTSNKENVYRLLDILSEHNLDIQKTIYENSKKMIKRNEEVIFYDLTNYYFESKQNFEDEINKDTGEVITSLGKKGVSKEKRKGPIVQMGLLMDSNNFPLGFELFPGNTIDKITLKPMLDKHFNNIKIKKGIVVADRITNTKGNLDYLYNNNFNYVISKSVLGRKKEEIEWIKDDEGYTWLNDGETFKYKSKIVLVKYQDELGNTKTRKEKWVVYWSKKHYENSIKENQSFRDYLERVTLNPDKLKDNKGAKEKYLNKTYIDKKTNEEVKVKVNYSLNDEKLEKQLSLLGYYLITTSEIEMDDLKVIDTYRNLGKIEDMFKTIKSTLDGRPIYVKTNDHIKAHFLICYISLVILRIIKKKTKKDIKPTKHYSFTHGMSMERIVGALNEFNSALISKGLFKVTKLENYLKTIAKAFKVNDELRLPTNSDLMKFMKKIDPSI